MSEKGQWFQCGLCKNLFIKAREEEDAIEEYINEFPGDSGAVALVCSDCYAFIMAWHRDRKTKNE